MVFIRLATLVIFSNNNNQMLNKQDAKVAL